MYLSIKNTLQNVPFVVFMNGLLIAFNLAYPLAHPIIMTIEHIKCTIILSQVPNLNNAYRIENDKEKEDEEIILVFGNLAWFISALAFGQTRYYGLRLVDSEHYKFRGISYFISCFSLPNFLYSFEYGNFNLVVLV